MFNLTIVKIDSALQPADHEVILDLLFSSVNRCQVIVLR